MILVDSYKKNLTLTSYLAVIIIVVGIWFGEEHPSKSTLDLASIMQLGCESNIVSILV